MEEENVVKTKKGSYITGILGAIVGGTIATIPWVLTYVYGNMMLSILAALIAAGEFYGYKLAKGKISKKLPAIIMVIAIIIVTVATLVVIPGLLIQKQGINVSLENIEKFYANSSFSTAIMKDFVVSVVFTILGASIITSNIKKQLQNSNGENIKLDFNNNEEQTKLKNNAIELIKPIFTKYDAVEKDKAMMKEEVLAEIEDEKAKSSFNYLKQLGIIKRYKGKYYYSEQDEEKSQKAKKFSTASIIGIIVTILAVIFMIGSILDNSSTTEKYEDGTISFEMESTWLQTESDYDTEWNFYKYINSFPAVDSEGNTQKEDYSSYPAIISVYYDVLNSESITTIEDIKTNLEATFAASEDKSDTLDMNISKTSNNYDLLKIRMTYTTYPEEVLYYYYILNGDNLSCITAYSFNLKDDEEIEKQADKLADTFIWNQ